MFYRCEGTFNCNDKSDEDECDLLIIDRDVYNKDYPPKPHRKAVEVKVYFTIDTRTRNTKIIYTLDIFNGNCFSL